MAELVERLQQRWWRTREGWWNWTGSVPPLLVLVVGFVTGVILGLLFGVSGEWTGALIGLCGGLLGGLITAVASFALERKRQKGQMMMATWAERVRAHQEAYELWNQILGVLYEKNHTKRMPFKTADEWYNRNCLFLTEEAREGFRSMLSAAQNQRILLDSLRGGTLEAVAFDKNSEKIMSLDRVLIEGACGHVSDEMLRDLRRKREGQVKKT